MMMANLRLFYQCRLLLVLYPLLLVMWYCDVQLLSIRNAGLIFNFAFIVMAVFGAVFAGIQKDIQAKANLFCLPGVQNYPRKILASVGIILLLVYTGTLIFFSIRSNSFFCLA